jgi:hypothetical protein
VRETVAERVLRRPQGLTGSAPTLWAARTRSSGLGWAFMRRVGTRLISPARLGGCCAGLAGGGRVVGRGGPSRRLRCGRRSLALASSCSRVIDPTSSGRVSRTWASAFSTNSSSVAPRATYPSSQRMILVICCLLALVAVLECARPSMNSTPCRHLGKPWRRPRERPRYEQRRPKRLLCCDRQVSRLSVSQEAADRPISDTRVRRAPCGNTLWAYAPSQEPGHGR